MQWIMRDGGRCFGWGCLMRDDGAMGRRARRKSTGWFKRGKCDWRERASSVDSAETIRSSDVGSACKWLSRMTRLSAEGVWKRLGPT